MTDLIEHADSEPADSEDRVTEGARGGPDGPQRRGLAGAMRRPRAVIVAVCVVVVAGALGAVAATTSGSGKIKPATNSIVSTVSVASPRYTPKAAVGATDDYHCNLVNPGIKKNSYVISSQFRPGSPEVHHAVLALVPPAQTAQALAANAASGGKGWTCFGAPSLPNASLAAFLSTPFLSVWAPGHGADVLPKDTGIALAKGSLVIEQVHYNLLVGDKPVTNSARAPHRAGLHCPAADAVPIPGRPAEHPMPGRRDRAVLQLPGVAQLPGPALRHRRRHHGKGHRRYLW